MINFQQKCDPVYTKNNSQRHSWTLNTVFYVEKPLIINYFKNIFYNFQSL